MKSKVHTPSHHSLLLPRHSSTPESFSSSPCTVNGGCYWFITLCLCCCFLLRLLDFIAEQRSHEHCFGQFRLSVLILYSSNLLPTSTSSWLFWARGVVGEAAVLWEYCSAVAKILAQNTGKILAQNIGTEYWHFLGSKNSTMTWEI